MNAASEVIYFEPVYPGDRLRSVPLSELAPLVDIDINTKYGEAGRINSSQFIEDLRKLEKYKLLVERAAPFVAGVWFDDVVRQRLHLAFDENRNPPLCNLYVSMLQRMGIEADKFGSGNATLTGLEMRG